MKRTIIIMAKAPAAGTVKTRLHTVLPPEKCATLAAAFLEDALEKARNICKNVILAYSPAGRSESLKNIIAPEIKLVEQRGANLGERMSHAFEFAFAQNSDAAVVMIGTDSPTFPADFLARAFDGLERDAEIALGECADGGFYLIGLRRNFPALFERVAWSTPQVFEQVTRNIKNLGIKKLMLLPAHYDVDTPDDLLRLKSEILNDEKLRRGAEKTARWLMTNGGIA